MAFGSKRDWTGYVSGWCPHCGRRRGSDGRCNNCDPWYTNPLVQYGAPFVAVVTVFLVAGAAMLSPRRAEGDTSPGAVLSAQATQAAYLPLNAPYAAPARVTSIPPMPTPPSPATVAANFAPSQPTDAQQFEELENLRRLTAYVDARVDQEREAQRGRERQNVVGTPLGARKTANVRVIEDTDISEL